ncbi:MAG: hypothetical protein KJZ96_10305 [Rhodocyclaceae bacterium]|jgi:hypothetical protein|nr:hypothetical protein [Rhodocyclaceae bacterium]MCL4758732.1 hypothetical protein [Rhodocyclaceae bacterium]
MNRIPASKWKSLSREQGAVPGAVRYRRIGTLTLTGGAAMAIAAALVAYPYAPHFPLGIQILGHLLIPVGAAAFKLGYVIRLAAQESGRPRGPLARAMFGAA